jgi:hypothetical protein
MMSWEYYMLAQADRIFFVTEVNILLVFLGIVPLCWFGRQLILSVVVFGLSLMALFEKDKNGTE